MADFSLPLRHDSGTRTDDELTKEAAAHFARSPALQVVAELISEMRTRKLPWWTPSTVRGLWSATDRMNWFDRRPDLRQSITSSLTGLLPKAARNKTPDFQGDLIDSALDSGDITAEDFDTAYDPRDLVTYGPAAEFWSELRNHLPWREPTAAHQDLVVCIFRLLLTDKSSFEGVTRKPILTVWELRSAIPSMLWQAHLPLEVRAAIDDARLRQEKANKAFLAVNEMAIATPKIICASLPLEELQCVLDAAERAMGVAQTPSINTTSAATSAPQPAPAPAPAPAASPASAATTPAPLPAAPERAPTSPNIQSTLPARNAEPTGRQQLDPSTPRSVAPQKAATPAKAPPPAPAASRTGQQRAVAAAIVDENAFEEVTDAAIDPGKR